jgi:hypothetical protein
MVVEAGAGQLPLHIGAAAFRISYAPVSTSAFNLSDAASNRIQRGCHPIQVFGFEAFAKADIP